MEIAWHNLIVLSYILMHIIIPGVFILGTQWQVTVERQLAYQGWLEKVIEDYFSL